MNISQPYLDVSRFSGNLTFSIGNSGTEISSTDYWTSEYARRGFCYLSGNAGTLRLLVPPATESSLSEMRTGKSITIERSIAVPGNFDIVFEDGSPMPFYLSLSPQMIDRKLVSGSKLPFAVWTQAGKVLTCRCTVRV